MLTPFHEVLTDMLLEGAGETPPEVKALQGEASLVDGCVLRFALGELDPTGQLACARYNPMSIPNLAMKLGSKLDPANPELIAAAGDAVERALGLGYLLVAEMLAEEPRLDREERDIWTFWSHNCRDDLVDAGFDKSDRDAIQGAGRDALIADLKHLGLTRFVGGSKLNQLGMTYARAGALLRLTQTDGVPEEVFASGVETLNVSGANSRWDWGNYPAP